MRVLVTGGAGYIGSVIVNKILQRNHKARVLDSLWYDPKIPLLHRGNPDYEFRKADITDSALLDKYLDGVDFVIHAAAVVGEPASNKFPKLAYKINYEGSIGLINKSKEYGVKGFIFLSTCSNYGMADGLATEETTLRPLSLYAKTKIDVEKYLMDETKSFGWVICRLSTAYGVSPRMRFDLTVNDFTMNAITKRRLELYLPHTYRPYIHVVDVAEVVMKIIENFDVVKNNVFNTGFDGENYQKIQIAEIIKRLVPEVNIVVIQESSDSRDYRVDFSKLYRFLNVKKIHTVEDGVEEIANLINAGTIEDCGDRKYYNIYPDLG